MGSRARRWLLVFVLAMAAGCAGKAPAPEAPASPPKPKYGPTAVPLIQDHAYFRRAEAPDFWALIPYYVPQEEHACQAASLSMVLNAWNARQGRKASDENVRQRPLIERANNPVWKESIRTGNCLALEQLVDVVRDVLKLHGYGSAQVEIVHVAEDTADARKRLRKMLEENERSDRDLVLANFVQGILTGDPEGMVGHLSLIGAYDAKARRVLILDVDRQWYEPYWVAEETLFRAMNTKGDAAPKYRGWIRVKR
jgi:hypothetical protein